MSDLDIAWAAGLFEGEGCITISYNGKYPEIGIQLVMTDIDVVNRFAQIVGGKVLHKQPGKEGWKASYSCVIRKRTEVERILNLFIPYLGERRTEKALEALSTPSSGIRWGEGVRAGESARYRARKI